MPDENIAGKIRIAGAMIDSAIGYTYVLPLKFRYGNTIVFTGEATGAATMAVVVNTVTYDIAIVATDNASSIADKFRIAAGNSADFLVDDL